MATVERRGHELESGHVAVLGHKILDAVSVVAGALDTLRDANVSMPPVGRDLLQREIDRCINVIVESARPLIRGNAWAVSVDQALSIGGESK